MGLKAGDTVGDYRILAPIASGGMGEVFRAEHAITRRVEAVKVLSPGGGEEQTHRFLREIQLQASLSHPNIAAVHNAFRIGDDLIMVMELIDGEPLRARLERGRPPLAEALSYARQALRAIGYAHAHGVVHRDLTPSNIILTAQGTVKLTDFGLAKARASGWASRSGAPLGSPHYMPPEQVRGLSEPDERSDLYSLGAVLYEMVTGRKPFEGDSPFEVMQAQVESAPVPPSDADPAVPAPLSDAILIALEKDPRRRFASAATFLSALEHAGAFPRAARRRILPLPRLRFAAVFLLTFALTFLAATRLMHPARHVVQPPPAPRVLATPAPTPAAAVPVVPPAGALPEPEPPVPTPAAAAPESEPPAPAPAQHPAKRRPRREAREDAPHTARAAVDHAPPEAQPAEPHPVPPAGRTSAALAPAPPPRQTAADPAPSPAPDHAAAAQDPKQKKPRNRLWRALGKIVSPFH